ncbi:MAG: sulfatase-like hydrolase/transferase, partial [Bacteroidales bacterium]|nr:sulfatase-like hydrolase/transferase [Bacteroidales bacterium]
YDTEDVEKLEKSIRYGGVDRPEKDISIYKKEYYGTVSQLDNAFANLLKVINDEDLGDNTLIIFTSDNGPEHPVNLEESRGEWYDPIREKCFGTPGILRGMKRYPYEGGHRVPGIVRWPGKIPGGSKSDKLFNATDIAPILCDLAGVNMPEDRAIDGVNAFEVLLGKEVQRDKNCLWIFPTHEDSYFRMPHLAMRDGDYSLLGWFPEKKEGVGLVDWMKESVPERFALYNIKTDPEQEIDISPQNKYLLEELVPEMLHQWVEIRDEGPDWGRKN